MRARERMRVKERVRGTRGERGVRVKWIEFDTIEARWYSLGQGVSGQETWESERKAQCL